MALGKYDYHWAESVLSELRLQITSEPDNDPLLFLAARFGLCTYVYQILQKQSDLEPTVLNTRGPSMVVLLSHWAMHDSSHRKEHFQIIEKLLESGLNLNAKSAISRPAWERTPWQEFLYFQTQNPGRQSLLRTDDLGQDVSVVSEVERLDVWTQLVQLFVKYGAELDVNYKPFKGAAREQTAREAILKVMTTIEIGRGLSSDESAVVKAAEIRIEQVLAEKPATINTCAITKLSDLPPGGHDLDNPVCASSQNQPVNERRPISPRPRQSRRSTSSKMTQTDAPVEVPSLVSVVMPADPPCQRCKTVELLRDMEFELDDVYQAMEQAGVAYDIGGLISWILDKSCNKEVNPRPTPPAISQPSDKLQTPRSAPGKSRDLTRQWSKVMRARSTSEEQNNVVGAQYVTKPPKVKPRRSPGRSSIDAENTQENASGSNSGEILLSGGTIT